MSSPILADESVAHVFAHVMRERFGRLCRATPAIRFEVLLDFGVKTSGIGSAWKTVVTKPEERAGRPDCPDVRITLDRSTWGLVTGDRARQAIIASSLHGVCPKWAKASSDDIVTDAYNRPIIKLVKPDLAMVGYSAVAAAYGIHSRERVDLEGCLTLIDKCKPLPFSDNNGEVFEDNQASVNGWLVTHRGLAIKGWKSDTSLFMPNYDRVINETAANVTDFVEKVLSADEPVSTFDPEELGTVGEILASDEAPAVTEETPDGSPILSAEDHAACQAAEDEGVKDLAPKKTRRKSKPAAEEHGLDLSEDESEVFMIYDRNSLLKGFCNAPNLRAARAYRDAVFPKCSVELDLHGVVTRSPGYSVPDVDSEGRLLGTEVVTKSKAKAKAKAEPQPKARP